MAQANLSVRIDENDIHINNNYLFTDLNEYQLQMDMLCNGNVVQTKTMTVDCQPLSSVVVENSFKINNQNQEYALTVYLKKNNHKSDIYKEYRDLKSNNINYKEYLDKYKFTHLLVKKNDPLYEKLKKDSYNYILIKRFKNYDIYINSDNM